MTYLLKPAVLLTTALSLASFQSNANDERLTTDQAAAILAPLAKRYEIEAMTQSNSSMPREDVPSATAGPLAYKPTYCVTVRSGSHAKVSCGGYRWTNDLKAPAERIEIGRNTPNPPRTYPQLR